MERARAGARDLGFDPQEVYEPWVPMDFLQQGLMALHGVLGEGSLAVIAAALAVRLLTWPLNIRAVQRRCDAMALMPIYVGIVKAYGEAQKMRGGAGGTGAAGAERAEAELEETQERLKAFIQETKFSPMQGMGYQFGCLMPLYFTAYCTLRGIVTHPDSFRDFVAAPTMWLESLVLPDPLGVLPALSALAVLSNAELNANPPNPGQERDAEYFKLVIRGATLAFVPITAGLPAAIFLFIATNGLYTSLLMWTYRRYWWVAPRIDPKWIVKKTA